jgi:hypothetical protein
MLHGVCSGSIRHGCEDSGAKFVAMYEPLQSHRAVCALELCMCLSPATIRKI